METIKGLLRDEFGVWIVEARLIEPTKRRRRRIPKSTRAMLLMRQDHRCASCRGPIGLLDSHIDHVVPVIEGGSDETENLQLLHADCNLRKGRRVVVAQGTMPWS